MWVLLIWGGDLRHMKFSMQRQTSGTTKTSLRQLSGGTHEARKASLYLHKGSTELASKSSVDAQHGCRTQRHICHTEPAVWLHMKKKERNSYVCDSFICFLCDVFLPLFFKISSNWVSSQQDDIIIFGDSTRLSTRLFFLIMIFPYTSNFMMIFL